MKFRTFLLLSGLAAAFCRGEPQLDGTYCGSKVIERGCEEAGRFWCGDACSLIQCGGSAVRPGRRRRGTVGGFPISREVLVDVSGRCLDARLEPKPGRGVYRAP